jgi:hypothetical protein
VKGKEPSTGLLLLYSEERELGGGPLELVSDTGVVTSRRAIGVRQVPIFLVGLTCGVVGLKLTRATVSLGRAQFFKPNFFYFSN